MVESKRDNNTRTWFKVSLLEQAGLILVFLLILMAVHVKAIAEPLSIALTKAMGDKHKDYPTEELSIVNWLIHFALVMIGRGVTSTLRQPYNTLELRSLGLVFALGEVSGLLFMMHHSLIMSTEAYAPILAMHLLIMGDYLVKMQVFWTWTCADSTEHWVIRRFAHYCNAGSYGRADVQECAWESA